MKQKIPSSNDASSIDEYSTSASTVTKKSALKDRFTEVLKEKIILNLNKLDKCHFWYLDSIEPTANGQHISVE